MIIVSAHKEYALESYEYAITDYLLKPFNFERFFKAIQKVTQAIAEKPASNDAASQSIFIKDDKPCYYLYEVTENKISRTGLIAITSSKDYNTTVIKKHEATISKRVKLFKDYSWHECLETSRCY